jgi:transcriptional regulator with PAS, ATPase and Fis domain
LGSVKPVEIDVRVVAATNQNLERLVREGKFRKDLFYRIRVVQINMPDLRERRMDIPLLVDHMIAKFNQLKNKDIAGVSDEVMVKMMDYGYPGNVRELENIIEHAFVLCRGGLIEMNHLPPELRPENVLSNDEITEIKTLKAMEKRMLSEALSRHRGNRKKAAKDLGIDYSTLYRKVKQLNIETPPTDGRSRNQ